MSRFNGKEVGTKTTNRAGGEAYKLSTKEELAFLLLTSFVKDQFYRSADDTMEEVRKLIHGGDKLFAAKAAIYARNEFGMRSISHVVAGEIAKQVKGESWTKNFFDKVIRRPDDMSEIFSYYTANYGKRSIPNSMRKGIAKALERFDEYSLAKYRGAGKAFNLVDLVNLCHPKYTEALTKLMTGKLAPAETWETKLTQAGQKAENDEQKDDLKGQAWKDLISEKKLGYFALLRNLRNIVEQAPEVLDEALTQLVDRKAIKKSLVLPFRFLSALDALQSVQHQYLRKIIVAVNEAVEISLDNVPKLKGRTLVVLDRSGSMGHTDPKSPFVIGSLFAAALYKSNDADLMLFSDTAEMIAPNPKDSLGSIIQHIGKSRDGGGTDFRVIFETAKGAYERIVILSDMQGWVGYDAPTKEFERYKKDTKCNPFVYSFDLQGYGTLQLPEDRVFCLAGFSEKTMDIMALLEEDRKALVHKIEAIEL